MPDTQAPLPALERVRIGIVSVSDRASSGVYEDKGLPALRDWLGRALRNPIDWEPRLIADEQALISQTLIELVDLGCDLVLTTGGTGPALRDVTPEAVREIAVRELPGFGEVMRAESMKITKNAILSRNLAAVVGNALVICLPGKPSGAVECLSFVVGAIPHCVEVLQEVPTSC